MPLPQRQPLATDLAGMDDDEFLELCQRTRQAKESMPLDRIPPELAEDFAAVSREFMRRAGLAWKAAYPPA